MLNLADIQSGVLRPRPTPYAATYLYLRINDQKTGRQLMGRASEVVASAAHLHSPVGEAWVSIALTFQGLKALGVPPSSLESFPPEFQQGMAGRAQELGDVGASSPEHWEKPFGTNDFHVAVVGLAPDREQLDYAVERITRIFHGMAGIKVLGRQDCYSPEDEKEHFGYRDGISHPAIEETGIPGSNPQEPPLKAGEFVLGYPDEMGSLAPMPTPDILGRNGTFVVIRKLHQRVAEFRQFLSKHAENSEGEELLAAKMMGRWRSGAPLALSPDSDNPELGADSARNNDFLYYDDDKLGLKTPPGSHIRRMNPRDAIEESGTSVKIRRMIRRGTVYGPHLAAGSLEDDGVDRGLIFVFVGANLKRQFEFVQSTWLNHGDFITAGQQKDPISGNNDGSGDFTIPRRPVRQRIQGLPQFVVTHGGEYCFMPGITALRWLADLPN